MGKGGRSQKEVGGGDGEIVFESVDVEVVDTLDLSGVPCPNNTARAAVVLMAMDEGEVLELFIDDGEPIENVPDSLAFEGHEILDKARHRKGWRLLVRRGSV